jgi:DNA-binding transcriptional LysR family regulator
VDRLEAMSVMLAAVDCGSLSKASRKLGLPLATVILEQLKEAERAAAGEYSEPKGDLVVSAPIMFGRLHLLPVVMTFLVAFPEISVELMLTDRVTHFLDDQVDVALRIGDLLGSSLIATSLGTVRRVTCASPTYLATRTPPITPKDLASHDVISFESVSTDTVWRYWSGNDEVPIVLRSRLSVSTIDAAIDAGLAGTGILRAMSYQVADFVRGRLLEVLLEPFEPAPRPIHLIYDRQNRLPLKVGAFVEFVVPRLRDRVTAASL